MKKKYKITLLKDLPDIKAGTVLLNVTEEELSSGRSFVFRDNV